MCLSFRSELVNEFPKIVSNAFGPFIGHHLELLASVRSVVFFKMSFESFRKFFNNITRICKR